MAVEVSCSSSGHPRTGRVVARGKVDFARLDAVVAGIGAALEHPG